MARAVVRRGHRVTVACYAHGVGEPDPEYAVVRTPAVPFYRNLRAGPDLIKPWLDLALAQRIASLDADIVHAHNYEAPLAAALARLRTGTPIVYCAHNTMGEELETYVSGRGAKALARGLGRALDRTVPRMADHAVVLRPESVPTLSAMGCHSVTCVSPGIDPSEFVGVVPAQLGPGPWVVYAGNPDRYQDLDVLMEAMALLPEVGLLLVSASPLDAFEGMGLARLRTVVTSDFAEVKALVAAADVAALPRTVCSGYPIKLLNNLALGVPTVAAAGSALPLPGVVPVPNHDAPAMAAAIQGLLADGQVRRRMGEEAREHVWAHASWDARAADLEAVYESVLTGQQGTSRQLEPIH